MTLIGLILIAALSGGIVAVSLRLRVPAPSARLRSNEDRSSQQDRLERTQSVRPRSGRTAWAAGSHFDHEVKLTFFADI
jgi:hypothetical protein